MKSNYLYVNHPPHIRTPLRLYSVRVRYRVKMVVILNVFEGREKMGLPNNSQEQKKRHLDHYRVEPLFGRHCKLYLRNGSSGLETFRASSRA